MGLMMLTNYCISSILVSRSGDVDASKKGERNFRLQYFCFRKQLIAWLICALKINDSSNDIVNINDNSDVKIMIKSLNQNPSDSKRERKT